MKPTPEDKAAGIKHKYNITRADGSPVDPQGMYFVLRLDYHEGCDTRHISACRRAAEAYAIHATDNLPKLSEELLSYLKRTAPNAGGKARSGYRTCYAVRSTQVQRFEDMSPEGCLRLFRQEDGDIIVCAVPDPEDCDRRRLPPFGISVEFCECGGGGGQSPHTRRALLALWEAIERDNAEHPQHR